MAKNANFVSHKKSKQIVDGKPKLPLASDIVEGEIAINFAENVETLSIKNESGDVVTFSSDNYYTEQKLGSGFTGENSAVTVTDVIDEVAVGNTAPTNESIEVWIDTSVNPVTVEVYTKAETNALLGNKQDVSGMTNYTTTAVTSGLSAITTAHTADTTIHFTTGTVQTQIDNSISGKVNTSDVGTMAYEDKTSYSSATEVDTAFGLKVNTADIVNEITSGTSASTNPVSVSGVMTVIKENELIISSALNDLETNKLDASAYTPTDLSNYYTKDETSGKTEISTALGTKVNSATFTGHTADTSIHFTTGAVQTQIDNSISGKVNTNTFDTIVGSGYTNTTITDVIESMDQAVAAAITDLNDKIGDIESILATI